MSNETEEWASAGSLPAAPEGSAFEPDRVIRLAGVTYPARPDPADAKTVEALFPSGAIRPVEVNPMVILKMERPPLPARIAEGSLELPWLLTVALSDGAGPNVSASLPLGMLPATRRSFWGYVRRLPGDGFGGAVYDVGIAITDNAMQNRAGGPGGGSRPASPYAEAAHLTGDAFCRLGLILPDDPPADSPLPCHIWRAQARRTPMPVDDAFRALHNHPEADDAIGRLYSDTDTGLSAIPLYRHDNGVLHCAVGTCHSQHGGPGPRLLNRSELELARLPEQPASASAPLLSAAARLVCEQNDDEINRVRAQARQDQARLEAAQRLHRDEVALIGSMLIEAADDNDLCSQFDRFVERVNARVTVGLPVREREYDVEIEVSMTLTIRTTASSESAARDNVDSSDVREVLREHVYSMDDDDWDFGDVTESD